MQIENLQTFSDQDHHTWTLLFDRLEYCRQNQAAPEFVEGLKKLGLTRDRIPRLEEVNEILQKLTGWQGVPVKGLEEGASFFTGLTEKKFPIGNFIRSPEVLSYTPAPDIFHDLYGHMPFFADQEYANFCLDFGRRACKYLDSPDTLKQFETLFWFTIEFALIETPRGRRIFGGGILSSFDESNYSLSEKPIVKAFHLQDIRHQFYRIDQVQPILFVLKNKKQLYDCLDEFEALVCH